MSSTDHQYIKAIARSTSQEGHQICMENFICIVFFITWKTTIFAINQLQLIKRAPTPSQDLACFSQLQLRIGEGSNPQVQDLACNVMSIYHYPNHNSINCYRLAGTRKVFMHASVLACIKLYKRKPVVFNYFFLSLLWKIIKVI